MFTLKINDIAPLPCRSLQLITWFSWLLTIKDPKYFIYENRLLDDTKSKCHYSSKNNVKIYLQMPFFVIINSTFKKHEIE